MANQVISACHRFEYFSGYFFSKSILYSKIIFYKIAYIPHCRNQILKTKAENLRKESGILFKSYQETSSKCLYEYRVCGGSGRRSYALA